MAMIGARRFDPNDPRYLGTVDTAASPLMPTMPDPLPLPALASKPSFFGQGGAGRGIAGAIGDYLLQLGHMQPIYAPAKAQQTAFERGEEQYQRRRQDALTDDERNFQQQIKLLDYKRLHPDDPLTQMLDQAGITDAAQRQQYYRQKADALTAPSMMSAQGWDAQGNPQMTFFPKAVRQSGPPAAAVAYLKAHPDQAQAFEQKYGAGSASQYLGGPTPPASGGFPR